MDDWRWQSAADLGRGIDANKIDPVALCDSFLDAIDAHPAAADIYARVTPTRARAEAQAAAARARTGTRRSPLDGVPVSWKDLFDTAGTVTEAGTPLMAGRRPAQDAAVLATATRMGLVCLGKTHLSEIAFSGLGVNPKTATSPNVHDKTLAPGGSSSGAAASVAFGLAAAGIGTDTGGSVRTPSAWNDLVGFKTTHGRVPTDGVVALAPGFDTVGPLCRSVEDAALLDAALLGTPAPDLRASALKDRRFAVDIRALDGAEDAPAAAFRSAVDRLRSAGALVEDADLPDPWDAVAHMAVLFPAEAWAQWADLFESQPGVAFHQIETRITAGAKVTARQMTEARRRLDSHRAAWVPQVRRYDAVLSPTVPILPPPVDQLLSDDAFYQERNLMSLRNTRAINLMGGCAVTLPTGVPSCGIMLAAPAGDDRRLLRIAAAAEQALA